MYNTISQALEGGMDRHSAIQMLQEVINEAQQYVYYAQTRHLWIELNWMYNSDRLRTNRSHCGTIC